MSPDPTKRFSDRAGSYAQGRPGYPTELQTGGKVALDSDTYVYWGQMQA